MIGLLVYFNRNGPRRCGSCEKRRYEHVHLVKYYQKYKKQSACLVFLSVITILGLINGYNFWLILYNTCTVHTIMCISKSVLPARWFIKVTLNDD